MPPDNGKTSQNGKQGATKRRADTPEDVPAVALEDWNADKETEKQQPSPNFCVLMDMFMKFSLTSDARIYSNANSRDNLRTAVGSHASTGLMRTPVMSTHQTEFVPCSNVVD